MSKTPLIVFLVSVALLAALLTQQKLPISLLGSKESKPFPTLALKSIDGGRAWNEHVLKDRVTLVNFLATWCGPCAEEMPELVALRQAFPKMQMVAVVWNDDPDRISEWLSQHGDPFRSRWLDKDGSAAIALGVRGIPESFIVDAKGNIRYRISGTLTPQLRQETLDPLLKQLLDEAAHADK